MPFLLAYVPPATALGGFDAARRVGCEPLSVDNPAEVRRSWGLRIGISVLPDYLWAVCGRPERLTRAAHRVGRAFVASDARPPPWTTLHCLVQQHAATFFAETEAAAGVDLPQFVKDEFDAFLECGILAHGFLRLHCGDCGLDRRVCPTCRH